MAFAVRPMQPEDVAQALEIEKDAFPTNWPPTPFRRELQNRLARYLVALEGAATSMPTPTDHEGSGVAVPAGHPQPQGPWLWRWVHSLKSVLGSSEAPQPPPETMQHIVGFAGVWFMADEAHLVSIGVREAYRGRGVGELLLVASLELSMQVKAHFMTLEVRVSNYTAQALYEKYGFTRVGVRKGYYTDNHEDAYVMTTSPLASASYQESFSRLVEAHRQKWGERARHLKHE